MGSLGEAAMGRKITLAEAREQSPPTAYLIIQCAGVLAVEPGCHHSGEMSLLHAITLWGEGTRLDELPLKCSRCGSRRVDVRVDYPRGAGGKPL
jgi:hypothetical protein